MELVRLALDDAYWLLERQTGGVLPLEITNADWYVSTDRNLLGALMEDQRDGSFRFVLLQRQGDGFPYSRLGAGQDYASRNDAEQALRQAARPVLGRSAAGLAELG